MNYEYYVWLFATEFTEGRLTDSLKNACLKGMTQAGFNKEKIEKSLGSSTAAYRNAVPSPGKFPLIIYACSWSAPSYENYALCEYLASHGYVVVSCPSMGAFSREMTGNMAGAESQVEDLQFLINRAGTLSNVDMNKIGVAGFSWGGLTNVLLQQKNNKIAAVVSYDGSIANANGMEHFKNYPFASYSKMNVPFMYMSAKGRKSNPFYDKLNYSDAYYLTFHKNVHRDFASAFIKTVNTYKNDTIEKLIIKNYEWQCKYTLSFFDAYVKGKEQGLTFVNTPPQKHGIADTLLTLVSKKARPMPPSQEHFIRLLKKEGLIKAKELYQRVHTDDPDYMLVNEDVINGMAYSLLRKSNIDEAIELFKFNAEVFPKSANAYDSLGDAYVKKGDKEHGIESYKKAIELNPEAFNTKNKLEKIQSSK